MLLDGHKDYIMKANCFFLLILLFSFTEQIPAQQDVCPPWFIPDNTSNTGCSCHHHSPKIYCSDPDFPLIRFGFCMTYNNETGATEFGPCPYIAHYSTAHSRGFFSIQLPSNVSLLNEFMCGPLNREGPLCGKCKDGYGIALYCVVTELNSSLS